MEPEAGVAPYFLSFTRKRKHVCLHITGACWRRPGREIKEFQYLDEVVGAQFDSKCKDCWRNAETVDLNLFPPGPPEKNGVEEVGEHDSSSSSSTDSDSRSEEDEAGANQGNKGTEWEDKNDGGSTLGSSSPGRLPTSLVR